MDAQIVVVGSLNVDYVLNVPRFPAPGETIMGTNFAVYPGGKGANQASAVGKLGGKVKMLGQVGGDAHADWLQEKLAGAGVDVSHLRRDETTSTGVALITIDSTTGQNEIVVVPGANGTFSVAHLEENLEVIKRGQIVLLQLEIPLETVEVAARHAKRAGAVVILDPTPARRLPDGLLAIVDYLTPNETELAMLTCSEPVQNSEEAFRQAQHLRKMGAGKIIVKRGGAGAQLLTDTCEQVWPAVPVVAVDTTAAGDAFNAGFAVALASGQSESEAGLFATAAAAISVTRKGAQTSMPTLQEVDSLLNDK